MSQKIEKYTPEAPGKIESGLFKVLVEWPTLSVAWLADLGMPKDMLSTRGDQEVTPALGGIPASEINAGIDASLAEHAADEPVIWFDQNDQ